MHDILVFALVSLVSAAIGLPFCLILPAEKFAMRWALAPPLGFGLCAVVTAISYVWGIQPWIGVLILPVGMLLPCLPPLLRLLGRVPSRSTFLPGAALLVVALLCLAPAWTGGVAFRVFQGNVYDHMHYLGSAAVYRVADYAALMTRAPDPELADPVFEMAGKFVDMRGAVAMILAGIATITRSGVFDCAYPFMAALQFNMWFAAAFVLANVLSLQRGVAVVCACALTIGFFEQYIFDINALSQLAAQPIFLVLFGCVVLAFDNHRFGNGAAAAARIAAIVAALVAGAFYLYPEALTIYMPAMATACLLAALHRMTRASMAVGIAGTAAGGALGLLACVPLWSGTGAYIVKQLSEAAADPPDWWSYFQRYLFGREDNYLGIIAGRSGDAGHILHAWFSLPVEAVIAGLGLFAILPASGWPLIIALAWKLCLYGFLALLLKGIGTAVWRALWMEPGAARTRFVAGSIVGCLLPIGILWTGHGWAAGKALSMAAPMLFALVILPLTNLSPGRMGVAVSSLVVFGHLALGAMRPWLVSEGALPGLPTAADHVQAQKAGLDWDYLYFRKEIQPCNGLVIDVANPIMDNLLRRLAVEAQRPWAASRAQAWLNISGSAHRPVGWQAFDCLASANSFVAAPGQRLIALSTDHSVSEFLAGKHDRLEIGVKEAAGVVTSGLFGVESIAGGALRWAAPHAVFELPNNAAAPARTLDLALWPMPLAARELRVTINGTKIFTGPPPAAPMQWSLHRFAADAALKLEIEIDAVTRFPRDPRALGFAIRELSLHR